MDEKPFPGLNIESSEFLNGLDGRSKCSKCQRSRKFYCYTCYIPVPEIEHRIPRVQLPLKVDILKHPSEVDGKSTAVHAGIVAPDDVHIYTYPCIPDYEKDKVIVVFPCKNSKTLEQMAAVWRPETMPTISKYTETVKSVSEGPSEYGCEKSVSTGQVALPVEADCEQSARASDVVLPVKRSPPDDGTNAFESVEKAPKLDKVVSASSAELDPTKTPTTTNEVSCTGCSLKTCENDKVSETMSTCALQNNESPKYPFERVIFIDSTWNQTRSIFNDERLKGLRCVELKSEKTKFWRHQKNNPETYLSTIEAIYYFMREFHEQFVDTQYSGQYDNLLFFFNFMYKKIRNIYDGGESLEAYKSRREKHFKTQNVS